MAYGEAQAWWADVQHLRDDYDRTDEARRRADQADVAARRGTAVSARRPAAASARRSAAVSVRHSPAAAYDGTAVPARRTIEIRGRTAPAPSVPRAHTLELDRRRPLGPAEQMLARPDRMALWALLMGVVLILVAVSTG